MTSALTARFETKALTPFGIEITAEDGMAIDKLDAEHLKGLVLRHKIVVLRGFSRADESTFMSAAKRFGSLLEWNFGHVLNLVVHDEPQNYLFTQGNVPYHWDGAFAEAVPCIQFFQCLEAPDARSGGETIFCDTVGVVGRMPAAELAILDRTEVVYRTDKKAHYGGAIRRRIIDRHPLTSATTIRFAEPLNENSIKLNPLSLEIFRDGQELTEAESETFLQDFMPRLHEPDVVYAHSWRDGDFLLADNHALLHGRRAFFGSSRRHIQRIHIL